MKDLERQKLLRQGLDLTRLASGISPQDVLPLHQPQAVAKDPEDLADPIAEIQILENLLGWDKAKRADFLKAEFKVTTRSRLTDPDLICYRRLLRCELRKAGRWVYVAS